MNNWSNLSLRLATAAILAGVFLYVVLLGSATLWFAFVLLGIAAAAWEWATLFKLPRQFCAFYAIATLLLAGLGQRLGWRGDEVWLYLPSVFIWAGLAPLWLRRGWGLPSRVIGLLLGWLLLLPTLFALLYLRAESAWLLLALVGLAIVADSAAYFAGRRFGRHKLAPAISPGKTREGALGGAVAVLLYTVLISADSPYGADPILIGAGLLLFVFSVLGDLFESWLKRRAGVKDSGNILPGHGGVLDRIDSQLAVLPLAALFWILWS